MIARIIAVDPFDLVVSQSQVALRVERRGGAHQSRALAVDVHGAALECNRRDKARRLESRADGFGEPGVPIERRRPFAVAVVAPVDAGQGACPIEDERGRRIARPGVVVLQRQHRDALAAVQ